MPKKTGVALFFLLVEIFLTLNYRAYAGYFQDDDMNSLSWTRWAPASEFLKITLTPVYETSFRTVGFYYYHAAEHLFGLDYPKYVAVIHVLHLLNIWVLWLLIRRLGSPPLAAALACLFYAVHAASFEVIWQPMFVFDLLCGLLCLTSILLWARGNWILSFVSFWLAYKSKELAVMLPMVLICYELWFGSRRWLKLVPFLAASLSFGLQALIFHPNPDSDYTFRFTWAALAKTVPFYTEQVFLVPYAGVLILLVAALLPSRRTWFGVAAMLLFFFPLIWLPGRVFAAYCYLPFGGLAIALAGIAERVKPPVLAAFFLLWAPLDIQRLNMRSEAALRHDKDAREWIQTIAGFAKTGAPVAGFVFKGAPPAFGWWGMEGSIKYFYNTIEVNLRPATSPAGKEMLRKGNTALLNWDAQEHRLDIQTE